PIEKGEEVCVFYDIGGFKGCGDGKERDWLSWEARLVRIKAQIYLAAPRATGRLGDGATGEKFSFALSPPPPLPPPPLSFRPHILLIARSHRPQPLQKPATGLRSNHRRLRCRPRGARDRAAARVCPAAPVGCLRATSGRAG